MNFKTRVGTAAALALALGLGLSARPAQAQSSYAFIGSLQVFGSNFCPRGWADANGQLLQISQNQALFSLLGTTYGGNGTTTFALPDMRGRMNIGAGNAPGLGNYARGQRGGTETVTLDATQIPSHRHAVKAVDAPGDQMAPGGNVPAQGFSMMMGMPNNSYSSGTPTAQMHGYSIGTTGGNTAHNNMPPVQVVRWCIALQGVFPSRP